MVRYLYKSRMVWYEVSMYVATETDSTTHNCRGYQLGHEQKDMGIVGFIC